MQTTQSLWSDLIKTPQDQPKKRLRLLSQLQKRKQVRVEYKDIAERIKTDGQLIKLMLLPSDLRLAYVIVQDKVKDRLGRPKRWVLRVPVNMWSAKQAVAWTFGLPSAWYYMEKET